MKPHVKIYFDYFRYDLHDFIPCEICEKKAVDIHHIECRGMGGTSQPERIENLMALCRSCHEKYGDISHEKEFLKGKHYEKLNIV